MNIGNVSSGTSSCQYMDVYMVEQHMHFQPGSEWLIQAGFIDSNCADGYRMEHCYQAESFTGIFIFETFFQNLWWAQPQYMVC
ncbi:hypothetical protein [Thalassomonas actiniarum]|uniref:Uncharacterized protein n=1 Tax=Thalassomonas actiniarum TaxID=485447 RepID=A0AAE9YMW0_9GAMM|nr:hypothetical protein [Thalassomonas actiniarum]WDD97128.1 hypothetical protein SG35_017430 [Thalassomonas actiniarum]